MFIDNRHICSVCGKILASYGCCIYGDEKYLFDKDLCEKCEIAVKDALDQKKYLLSFIKK